MQRFVNDPDYIVEDMVKGYVKAHKDLIKRSEANDRVVQYVNAPVEGKVGLVTGGGSGHEPAFLGYVGKNMMDAVAVGEIFSSPSVRPFSNACPNWRSRSATWKNNSQNSKTNNSDEKNPDPRSSSRRAVQLRQQKQVCHRR